MLFGCGADLVITHALEWPSLTVQWLPVRPSPPAVWSLLSRRALSAICCFCPPNGVFSDTAPSFKC